MNNTNGRILVVTDIDENLVLEYVDLDDLKNERILPRNCVTEPEQ